MPLVAHSVVIELLTVIVDDRDLEELASQTAVPLTEHTLISGCRHLIDIL